MSLDISTPKGQESLAEENILLASFCAHKGFHIAHTPKHKASDVDGFVCKGNEIVAVFESKCRACNYEQMQSWGMKWLVTYEKIAKGANIAKALQVPFYGLLYLTKEPIGAYIRISDSDGNFIPDITIARTTTQKTINGGEVQRTNAYISLQTASTFPIIQPV